MFRAADHVVVYRPTTAAGAAIPGAGFRVRVKSAIPAGIMYPSEIVGTKYRSKARAEAAIAEWEASINVAIDAATGKGEVRIASANPWEV